MKPTKYARDHSGATVGMAHWKWGSRREMSVGGLPERSVEALDGHLIFVETTTQAHFRLGGNNVEAQTDDPILKPGAVYAFPRARGEDYVSVLVASGQPDGSMQYWQADEFEEA